MLSEDTRPTPAKDENRPNTITGADVLCDTLLANGVNVCFANPGTSEMHFVAALDRKPAMRCVLGLFEGVVTGAADGYGRMTRSPAATLLHTGPGLANGLANLHNARRARAPVLNVVGDHARYHLPFNPPLASDIESLARPMSDFVRRIGKAENVQADTEAGYLAALANSSVSTLILPADASWSKTAARPASSATVPPRKTVDPVEIKALAERLRRHRGRFGIVVGCDGAFGPGLVAAGRIAAGLGGRVYSEVIPGRQERGQGAHPVTKIVYPIDAALRMLADVDLLLCAGAPEPVAFFAYPGKPSQLVRPHAEVLSLGDRQSDIAAGLEALAAELSLPSMPSPTLPPLPDAPVDGAITGAVLAATLARAIPEGAIVAYEGVTSAVELFEMTAGAPHHDWMMTAGGAIGNGMPMALGAAIACPGRKIVCVQADGSGMYTPQALWTMAREQTDVLVVICANRRYAILEGEMANLGFDHIGHNARQMMSLTNPTIDWVALSKSMGVEAARAESTKALCDLVRTGMRRRGPFLIEVVL
jgi:acetolactate synthase-1/2/3 large subunit